MSVATSQHKNFVGGEFVDAVEGGTAEIINPSTGETIAEVPNERRPTSIAVEAAKRAWPEWRDTRRRSAPSCCSSSRTQSTRIPTSSRASSPRTSANRSGTRDEMPVCADNLRFFAGAARTLEGAPRASTCAATHP